MIWLEGRNPVREALKQDKVTLIIVEEKKNRDLRLEEILDLARKKNIHIEEVTRSRLDNHSKTGRHQGIIAVMKPNVQLGIDEVLQETGKDVCLLILDKIQDPHNLGAILRTAEATGVDGVIIPKKGMVDLTPTVHRVSMGGSLRVPVWKKSFYPLLKKLKNAGLLIIGVDSSGLKTIYEENLARPTAFLIGGEDRGISSALLERCDLVLSIPMRGHLRSLNVSVATGIVLYERLRQQEK
jgi:23S rRNA (guanosine2251-2'-O)-methyltransferase